MLLQQLLCTHIFRCTQFQLRQLACFFYVFCLHGCIIQRCAAFFAEQRIGSPIIDLLGKANHAIFCFGDSIWQGELLQAAGGHAVARFGCLRAIPERGALHRERCIPVRLRQHQYPNRPPHTEEGAQNGCTLLRKECHRRAQIKTCLIAALRQSIQEQVSCGDFCRCRAGIGRIKDTACFCHIAFPCKLYQFCIGKFFIEFFLRAATQPQSGNVHGNAQVLHRPPKKRTEYAVPQWNCFIPAGYWAG